MLLLFCLLQKSNKYKKETKQIIKFSYFKQQQQQQQQKKKKKKNTKNLPCFRSSILSSISKESTVK